MTAPLGAGLPVSAPLPLAGHTIVCLATQAWDAHWSVAQQVASRLAPLNRVIYVEPFHPPLAWLRKKNALLRRERDWKVPAVREVLPGVTVCRPESPYLPGNMRVPPARAWNGFLYGRELRSMMRRLNAENPILWAFFSQSLAVARIPCEAFVYDCVDDWPSFFPNPTERRWVERIDQGLSRRADVVFVGSEPLREKKMGQNARISVVNHAADVEHFMQAAASETLEPPDIAALPCPRIGFVGMVDPLRFDTRLIARLAENRQYQIVIVGGFLNGAERLIPDLPNIHRLGMRKVADLPAYIKGMQVCMMPYRLNETTRYIFPLKLFEYLASGKPVVATPIPAVEKHREFLYVASNEDDFVELVGAALREDPLTDRLRRQEHARKHDWAAHVTRKAQVLAAWFGADSAKGEACLTG